MTHEINCDNKSLYGTLHLVVKVWKLTEADFFKPIDVCHACGSFSIFVKSKFREIN